jgi:hypothetical protein
MNLTEISWFYIAHDRFSSSHYLFFSHSSFLQNSVKRNENANNPQAPTSFDMQMLIVVICGSHNNYGSSPLQIRLLPPEVRHTDVTQFDQWSGMYVASGWRTLMFPLWSFWGPNWEQYDVCVCPLIRKPDIPYVLKTSSLIISAMNLFPCKVRFWGIWGRNFSISFFVEYNSTNNIPPSLFQAGSDFCFMGLNSLIKWWHIRFSLELCFPENSSYEEICYCIWLSQSTS